MTEFVFEAVSVLAGTESCAVFKEDTNPKYLLNSLWEDFGGWEHFAGEASYSIIYNYLDKLESYLSEDDIYSIECGEYWYQDLEDKIPDELYSEINELVNEYYDDIVEDFNKFEKEFSYNISCIYDEIEEINSCDERNDIPVKYGINWDEINTLTDANEYDIHYLNSDKDTVIIEFPNDKWLFNCRCANKEHDINTWVNNTYGSANNMILALEVK